MSIILELLTKEDLAEFRIQLLNDLQQLMTITKEDKLSQPWLKNSDVKKLLNISSNTVQRLRISGKLQSTKIGGIHYYRYEEIKKLLEADLK